MKVSDIEERIAKIEAAASETDGKAHELEGDLFLEVLEATANGGAMKNGLIAIVAMVAAMSAQASPSNAKEIY